MDKKCHKPEIRVEEQGSLNLLFYQSVSLKWKQFKQHMSGGVAIVLHYATDNQG